MASAMAVRSTAVRRSCSSMSGWPQCIMQSGYMPCLYRCRNWWSDVSGGTRKSPLSPTSCSPTEAMADSRMVKTKKAATRNRYSVLCESVPTWLLSITMQMQTVGRAKLKPTRFVFTSTTSTIMMSRAMPVRVHLYSDTRLLTFRCSITSSLMLTMPAASVRASSASCRARPPIILLARSFAMCMWNSSSMPFTRTHRWQWPLLAQNSATKSMWPSR
mmetsp:Transcript_56692/g.145919  ORF Transcript_56692/g.145919 Transcript_56692/m.145919 type:complete len:217 (+) Transcript_56692:799-1449(+)